MFRLEAPLCAHHSGETLQHQSRADQQHDGHRDFGDDKNVARAARCHAGGRSVRAFLQRFVQVGSRELPRGREPEQDARQR